MYNTFFVQKTLDDCWVGWMVKSTPWQPYSQVDCVTCSDQAKTYNIYKTWAAYVWGPQAQCGC